MLTNRRFNRTYDGATCIRPALACVLVLGVQLAARAAAPEGGRRFDVRGYGAVGDGRAMDTDAIQQAIDAASAAGGGTVVVPAGRYLAGSVHLKSHVAIYLDAGATIAASPNKADFDPYEKLDYKTDSDKETTYFHYSLLWGEDITNVTIHGPGTIDGNRSKRGGPKPVALKRCRFVTVRDITIRNAPNYCISLLGCDYVNIDGVTMLNNYCDGIDPDSCRYVRISNCHIESWDDAIVPKASFALGERRATEYLTVTNCVLSTSCNAFKLGTESGGGFKYITVSNVVMYGPPGKRPTISGIALETVDGQLLEGVTITNVSMQNVSTPIFLRLGNRGRDMKTPKPGRLRNVTISNVEATGATLASSIVGLEGHPIEGVTLSNLRLRYRGGGGKELVDKEVPELPAKYPEAKMFGDLPAYGLYCRHVKDLRLRDVGLHRETRDERPALICDDVEGLQVTGLTGDSTGESPFIWFRDVRSALIGQSVASTGTDVFLRISGGRTADLMATGNDLSKAGKPFVFDAPIQPAVLFETNNRLPAR